LKELVDKHGVQLKKFPDEVIKELRAKNKEVMEEEAKTSPNFKRVYDSINKFMGEFTYWMEASEWSYIDAFRLK
jgi:TRAP-type mannitol/chloroaromatic compound transport system substrate-binding protein